jgi:hypothetical protein
VLADWWFSLALSKDIYQPIPGGRRQQTGFFAYSKVIALAESQPLKGLSDSRVAIASCLDRACLMGVAIKNFLDSMSALEAAIYVQAVS